MTKFDPPNTYNVKNVINSWKDYNIYKVEKKRRKVLSIKKVSEANRNNVIKILQDLQDKEAVRQDEYEEDMAAFHAPSECYRNMECYEYYAEKDGKWYDVANGKLIEVEPATVDL